MDKNAKQSRAKAEEAALNRILCWVVGGAVLESFLLLLNRYWSHYTMEQFAIRLALDTAVKVLAVAGLLAAAAAAFWWANARKNGRGTNLPGTLCIFLVGISVSCFAAWFFSGAGLRLVCILVPAAIVLALIYYLYQREFFLLACQSALGLLGVWFCSQGLGGSYTAVCYIYVAAAAVVLLGTAVLYRNAQGNQGVVKSGSGKKFQLFSRDANYAVLYTGTVIALLVLLGAALSLHAVILYAVIVAWLLIMAVYYTVKLM